jgi:collagen type VII alpha
MASSATYNALALQRYPFLERHVLAGGSLTPGDITQLSDGLAGVFAGLEAAVLNDPVVYYVAGVFDVLSASATTFAAGAPVFWNTSTKLAVTASGASIIFLGTAVVAKANGQTRVSVALNAQYSLLNSTTVTFNGATGANSITFPQSLADAIDLKDAGGNVYQTINTTTGSVAITGISPGTTSAGGTISLTAGPGGATSGNGGAISLTGGAGTAGNGVGGAGSLVGGAGQGTGAGGAVSVTGGASGAGATGNGGAAGVTGGAASSTNGTGGAASLIGGAGAGTGAGGAITITSGAAGATGVAGAINIAVGGATSGNGSAVTITGGNGAGGTNSGGNVNLVPGAAVSTGTPGEVQINSASGFCEASWSQFLAASVPVSGTSYVFFMANRAYRVKAVSAICSSTGTTPTIDITKDTGTNAPGAGTSVLTGVMTLSGTANTRVTGTLTSTVATLTMAAGDRLAAKWGGTVGSLTGGQISVLLQPC